MGLIEPVGRAERQTDAVKRQGVSLGNGFEVAVWRAARAHVVFRMHFEPPDVRLIRDDFRIVLGLEPDSGAYRNRVLLHPIRGERRAHGGCLAFHRLKGAAYQFAAKTLRYDKEGVFLPIDFRGSGAG